MNREDLIAILKDKNFNRKLIKAEFDKDADLSNLDLSGIDFADAIGEHINFSNSNLSNCDFTG